MESQLQHGERSGMELTGSTSGFRVVWLASQGMGAGLKVGKETGFCVYHKNK